MRSLLGILTGTLAVVGLPGLWLLLSPDPSAVWARQVVGLADEPTDDGYVFLSEHRGEPVGWDPCTPITYVVDPAGAPEGWESHLEAAVSSIEDASGLDLRPEGTVADRDFDRSTALPGPAPPVLVAWADADEHPPLAGDVAGVGGSVASRVPRPHYVTGSVVIDTRDLDEVLDGPGGGQRLEALLVHELAHVLGLDHTDDPTQLMHAEATGALELGDGDREGLRRLGDLDCL